MRPEAGRVALTLVLLGVLAGCPADKVVRRDAPPVDALAMEREAAAAYAAGEWQTAADRYASLVAQAPRVAESWFRLGNARARLGQTDPAIAAYREALVRDPAMVKAWHNMGLTQLREAATTFAQMNQYAGADDPLRDRANRLAAGVADLLRPIPGAVAVAPASVPDPRASDALPAEAATATASTPPEPVPLEALMPEDPAAEPAATSAAATQAATPASGAVEPVADGPAATSDVAGTPAPDATDVTADEQPVPEPATAESGSAPDAAAPAVVE